MSGAAAFCTLKASTRRNTDLGNGRRGTAIAHLSCIWITPLYPVSGGTVQSLGLTGSQPREMKECFHVPTYGVALPDVQERDILVVDDKEYPVDHVGEWPDTAVPTLHIVVGEVKRG